MKEWIKSAILILLVINSIILTGLLIFYSPSSGNVSLSEYLPRVKFGDNKELPDLIMPTQFIFHYGNKEHTKASLSSEIYKQLYTDMKDWVFYDSFTDKEEVNWSDLLDNRQGIEVIFPSEIPISLLSNIVGIGSDNQTNTIDRIWLYQGNEEYIQAYFISDSKDMAWKVKTSISSKQLSQYLTLNEGATKYYSYLPTQINSERKVVKAFYLPVEPSEIEIYQIPYQLITVDDMIKVLFVDPNMVRKVYETENRTSMLYTDGSRSMEFFSFDDYITYYQPSTFNQKAYSVDRDVQAAIRFVNQHGGWDGSYLLERVEPLQTRNITLLNFRFFIDGKPIFMPQENEEQMAIQVTNGTASSYQRTMIMLNPKKIEVNGTVKLYTETSLSHLLEQKGIQLAEVNNLELYYQFEKHKQQAILVPYIHVETGDGQKLELPVKQGGV